jgi:lysophospholipase L1-like esterase
MPISSPTDISNCSLWLQAEQGAYTDAGSTLAANNQTVQQWNDLSGNTRHASQATAGSRPTYIASAINGKPALRFASKNLQTTSFLGVGWNTACTFFIVCNRTSGNSVVVAASSNGVSGIYVGSDVTPTAYTGSLSNIRWRSVNGLNTPLATHVQTFRHNGTSARYAVNGRGRTAATTGSLGLTGTLSIGALSSAGSFAWPGDIAEIILYQRALTDAEVLDVENFLYARYGLSQQLAPVVVFDGDSITVGSGATTAYPSRTMTAVTTAAWVNIGVSGQTIVTMNSDRVDQVEGLYRSDAATSSIIALFGGTNDLYGATTSAAVITSLQTYAAGVKARGLKCLVGTILPRSNSGIAADFEAKRQAVNTAIRTNTGTWHDGVMDFAGDTRIGDAGDETNTTYYSGDLVHPNDTGAQILANIASAAILSVFDSTAPAPASAAINTAGTALVIAYTEAGSPPMLPTTGVTGYTLSSSTGVAVTVSSGTISTTTVTLTLSRTIYDNETITYSYSQGTGNVTDTAGNEIAAQINAAVANGSTVSPSISSVSTDAVVLVGTASTITWSSAGIIGTVDILLSLDGGSTFPITIVSGTANDGSHSWTPVIGQITATGVIRVRSTSSPSYHGSRSVLVATTSGGIGGSTGLWFRLQELAVNDGLELSRP